MSATEQPNQEQRKYTQEEIEAKRAEMDAYYTKMIPRLENQLKFEELQTKVTKEQYARFQMEFQMASMIAPDPAHDKDLEPAREEGKTPERKLAKSEEKKA